MNSKQKFSLTKIIRKLFVIGLGFLMVMGMLGNKPNVAFAEQDINNIYKEIALNFFETQYENRQMEYEQVDVFSEKNLYNDNEEIVAKLVILQRDEEYDYIVFNYATEEIDEFVFNATDINQKFSDKLYYTGLLNYFKKVDNNFIHTETLNSYSYSEFKKSASFINNKLKTTRQKYSKFTNTDGNPLPNPNKTGWNGFYSWSTIYHFNKNNGYSNSDWNYLNGIWFSQVSPDLSFVDQNTFNRYFGTDNACGPTACTNMFIWFQYMNIKNKSGNVNALLNGSTFDTFNRFRELLEHTNAGGTKRNKYDGALKNYASERGYNYKIVTGVNTYAKFKDNIDNSRPVLTSIDLDIWGGHAIVVVGYEEFKQSYEKQHQFLWWKWTTTEYRYSRYLRVIDGWSTSNDSRFIDVAGYWDTVTGRGFALQ